MRTEGWKVYSPEARATYPRSKPDDASGSAMGYREEPAGYLAGPPADL